MSDAWTISREVIIVAIGWIATLWWQSVRLARIAEGIGHDLRGLRRDVDKIRQDVDDLDDRDKAQSAANAAAAHLYQQQQSEFREHVAQHYATKRDVEGIESRLMTTLDRMDGRLDTMDGKLDDVRDRLPGRGAYPAS